MATRLTLKLAHQETMGRLNALERTLKMMHREMHVSMGNQRTIYEGITDMAGEIDRIETEVTGISGAVDSSTALLKKLADLIKANANDPVRMNKIADDLMASKDKLAAAVAANDPGSAEPPAEEPPVEEPPAEEPPADVPPGGEPPAEETF